MTMTDEKKMTLDEALQMNEALKTQIEQSSAVMEDLKFTNQAVSEEYSKALQDKVTLSKGKLASESEAQKLRQEIVGLKKTNDALIAAENERMSKPDDGKIVDLKAEVS
jgi:hypothetical protein